jgi:hypothetical protein
MGCDGETYVDPIKADNSHITEPKPGVARIMICLAMLNVKMEFFESFLKFGGASKVSAAGF